MSLYLDPTGKSTYGLGVCGRCSRKFFLGELMPDPNSPSLMVCRDDIDQYDPYRLPPRQDDMVALLLARPDTSLGLRPAGLIQEAGDEFLITEDGEGWLIP